MSKLIIVESPAKAKTIKNFLGSEYKVIASKGHIRDLPKSSFGIKIEDDKFTPEYRVSSDHSAIVKEIKDLAKSADTIYLATDEDREGEAIAYHIAAAIGKKPEMLPRIVFHEITKSAIQNALENPRSLNMDSVNAQQARRLLDRIVGYKLSPLLNSKIQRGLSAGRVQSSALKILVDKEREIRNFKPIEYFSIDTKFKKDLEAELVEFEGSKIEKLTITNKDRAKFIVDKIKDEGFSVANVESKERKISPQPPFMTSTLQQSASNRLGFSPKKTMMLAQNLYEGVQTNNGFMGAITYMRTDSLNLAKEAISAARDLIKEEFGDKYLPKSANFYTTKNKGAQEAHEAIRPTNLSFTPAEAAKFLEKDLLKLYTLIYNRFLACQMSASVSQTQNIFIKSKSSIFKISGRKLVFDGFYKVYGDLDKDKILPNLNVGDKMELESLSSQSHFTEPPSRYSEAGLVKKLESLGIGRPSTYAPTISLLTSRDYVKVDKKQLIPNEIAFNITSMLEEHFNDIVDSDFTSKMEEKLDDIAENKADWQEVLSKFYHPFMQKIDYGKKNIKSQKITEPIGEKCPECGGELVKRKGRFGEFIACLNFPKCKYSRNLKNEAKVEKKEPQKIGVACPQCGGDIVERFSKKGKFFGCANYPKCNFISKYQPTDQKCPQCGKMMVYKELKKGNFYECSACKFKKEGNDNE
ncbi:type I DNA topoisomerase [Campylobacter fetus]|uniref:DNA topoisomerase 1 n=4 Tax=Campylobacter fetus TaxID=196 RepID=A0AAX0HA03_CAMFE|nr:type I DNA topoisomerase [Campylobacter fetus]AGZ81074.1 DNA topoisomerase I [Campylobacter fetus subsp. testudinum 03-427]ALV64168.1 DNA topoisomerase I [Campylobacter fetus subsp. testudinum Sp3]AVK80453.1 type I DNA topoisomerase [Campylobacter fetus subsp. testudinum]EAI4322810.1 type I DNA topoisomerase [Campylobacter fetus]EAI4392053.1 type I DNA topoisomerase [Campylobacter fetus]